MHFRTCAWCNKEIKPNDTFVVVEELRNGVRVRHCYHPICQSEFVRFFRDRV